MFLFFPSFSVVIKFIFPIVAIFCVFFLTMSRDRSRGNLVRHRLHFIHHHGLTITINMMVSGWNKMPGYDFHSYFHFQAEKNGLVMISTLTFTFRLRKMAWWWSTSSHTSSPAAITLRLTTWSVRPRIFYTFKEDINYHLFKDQSI